MIRESIAVSFARSVATLWMRSASRLPGLPLSMSTELPPGMTISVAAPPSVSMNQIVSSPESANAGRVNSSAAAAATMRVMVSSGSLAVGLGFLLKDRNEVLAVVGLQQPQGLGLERLHRVLELDLVLLLQLGLLLLGQRGDRRVALVDVISLGAQGGDLLLRLLGLVLVLNVLQDLGRVLHDLEGLLHQPLVRVLILGR